MKQTLLWLAAWLLLQPTSGTIGSSDTNRLPKESADRMLSQSLAQLSSFQVISNPNADESQLIAAVKSLPAVIEPPAYWAKIISSQNYSVYHRQISLMELFLRHVRPNETLQQIGRRFAGGEWIKNCDVWRVEAVIGWIPVTLNHRDSIFCLRFFPKARKSIACYIHVSGRMQTVDFIRLLSGQHVDSSLETRKIVEIGFCPNYPKHLGNN